MSYYIIHIDSNSATLASTILVSFNMSIELVFGVTPFSSIQDGAAAVAAGGSVGATGGPQQWELSRAWTLSSCIDPSSVLIASRRTAIASIRTLAALYEVAEQSTQVTSNHCPHLLASTDGITRIVPELMPCLLRSIGLPIAEINTTVCDIVSRLSRINGGLALVPAENMVKSHFLFLIS